MRLYPLFLLVATVTVVSPGPGVVMTITSALRCGVRGTFGGILGIAGGALVVAAISATSLGALLSASSWAFTVLKFTGAGYLVYLCVRLWRAPAVSLMTRPAKEAGFGRRFFEGLSLQLTNPKAVFFFLSVLPQFIDTEQNYLVQFVALVLTYSLLVIGIHSAYAFFAKRAHGWLLSRRGGRAVNRAAGAAFVFFGGALATAKR